MERTDLEPTLLLLLAENVPHHVYAKDCDGRFIFANQAVSIAMGATGPEGLLGRTDFDFYPAEDAQRYTDEELEVMRSGQPMLNREQNVSYTLLGRDAWIMVTKLPLRDREGRLRGIVGINYDVTRRKRAEDELRLANQRAEAATRQLEDTVARLNVEMHQRQRVENELRQRALHDDLTGLPNRCLLMDRLDLALRQAERTQESVTVLFIDLDRFKQVNDTLGHAIGDELLKSVAERAGACVRQGDTLGRLGGDEFVLILSNNIEDQALAELSDRIARVVAQPLSLHGQHVEVSCSMGHARFPRDGTTPAALMQYADAQMYRAKQKRFESCVQPADAGVRAVEGPRQIEMQLRHALARNEFKLQYQPQVDLRSGRVVGVEALIRWQHPDWGLVSPLRFIPVAEHCGEIGRIGEWVLRTACAQAVAWRKAGLAPLRMAVNLSAQQFLDAGLEGLIARVLGDTGLPAQQLELELTESVSMRNPEESIRLLARFRAMGISLAIDDFGTGYSNLTYLLRFPVDRLKLDRSFISELGGVHDSLAIVEPVIAMAHRLRLEVIAEGVETREQQALLTRLGCDGMQGYWFARPADAVDCERLLLAHAATLEAQVAPRRAVAGAG